MRRTIAAFRQQAAQREYDLEQEREAQRAEEEARRARRSAKGAGGQGAADGVCGSGRAVRRAASPPSGGAPAGDAEAIDAAAAIADGTALSPDGTCAVV